MKISIKDFFSKCDQIRSFLRIWSHLLKKSVMENLVFCAVIVFIKVKGSVCRGVSKTLTIRWKSMEKTFFQGLLF